MTHTGVLSVGWKSEVTTGCDCKTALRKIVVQAKQYIGRIATVFKVIATYEFKYALTHIFRNTIKKTPETDTDRNRAI